MPQTENGLYTDLIIDLYKNPLNNRSIKNADITHSGVNVTCGDHVRVYAKLDAGFNIGKTEKISDASFEGVGCAISIASVSLLTDEIKGKTLAEILDLGPEDIFALLGVKLNPSRVKCGLLCLETLQEGIKLFKAKTTIA